MVKRSMDQKLRLQNFGARNERTETGAVVTNRRVNVVLKEDQENAINGKQKDSVREETSVVSCTMRISVQSRHQKPVHPVNHQHKEVEVRRGKRTSEAGVHLGSLLDRRAEMTLKVSARDFLVITGIFPNVYPTRKNRDAISGISSRLCTGSLNINPAKTEKGW